MAKPSKQSLALREAKLYDDWLKSMISGQEPNGGDDVAKQHILMPDLKGLSLRKALRSLQPLGLKVKVVGYGRVVAQLPQPNSNIGQDECVLTLQSDI